MKAGPDGDVCALSAVELSRLYRERLLSPQEVVDAVLTRIRRENPKLNAFITVLDEEARAAALVATRRFAGHCDPVRPLEGIPISLKDLTPLRGVRTTRGSLLYESQVSDESAVIAERLMDAGAIILGKTTTSEFGWKADAGNRVVGPARNPWRPELTAGGSSGGAAVATATGMGPLAQGTDGAGSIRIPASFCGVVGFKPSFGLIPYYPPSAVPLLAHVGPLARSVEDISLFLDAVMGLDRRDPFSRDRPSPRALTVELTPRIAWSPTLGYANVDPQVRAVVANAVDELRREHFDIDELDLNIADPFPIVDRLWVSGQAALHLEDFREVKDQLDKGRVMLIERAEAISSAEVARASLDRIEFANTLMTALEGFDFLITPTVPCEPFAAGRDAPPGPFEDTGWYLKWTSFTYPFNLTGQPAISVPCGRTSSGMPVGLQIVGPLFMDSALLDLAARITKTLPFQGSLPSAAREEERGRLSSSESQSVIRRRRRSSMGGAAPE